MGRLFLAAWLAIFATQTSGVLAVLAPDACVEDARGSVGDPCGENCARCSCCARLPAFESVSTPRNMARVTAHVVTPGTESAFASADPRGILHVPKSL